MLRRLLPALIATGCLLGAAGQVPWRVGSLALAQTTEDDEGLYYMFNDERISLTERTDQIAVQFVEQTDTRGGQEPAYLQLREDLEAALTGTRGGAGSGRIEVSPLGSQYALITLPETGTRGGGNEVQQQLDQPYIAATLPVLSREGGNDSIVVTSEIVVSFAPDTTDAEAAELLAPQGLEIVRPLRFSPGRYLVTAPNAAGAAVLSAANQLNSTPGIRSATPNFVQSLPYQETPSELQRPPEIRDGDLGIEQLDVQSEALGTSPFPDSLLPLQWYLNSESLRPDAPERTDIHALEAWEKGSRGENVTVAVIDSLMQWDHPDLIGNVYRLSETVANPLPGEVSGWDFSGEGLTCSVSAASYCSPGDPDTRISNEEVDLLRPDFQNSVALSDEDLLAEYEGYDEYLQSVEPDWSAAERADYIRFVVQMGISAEFHGTWSAGVIAANPQAPRGMVGVAPNATFLPVRVFGLGGSITAAALIEASGYAAARGADVINFSLGGSAPLQEFDDQLSEIMAADPSIVIVASAGNEDVERVSFPAANPGVVAVGSTNISGNRSFYSSFGEGLDVVAPGGETETNLLDGILTAGGTWVPGFWQGLDSSDRMYGPALDPRGQYVGVQGTSFSAPAISGVVALMKGVDSAEQLSRDQLVEILAGAADYDELVITADDSARYGTDDIVQPVSAEEYFFGRGLVDAEVAVEEVRRSLD